MAQIVPIYYSRATWLNGPYVPMQQIKQVKHFLVLCHFLAHALLKKEPSEVVISDSVGTTEGSTMGR